MAVKSLREIEKTNFEIIVLLEFVQPIVNLSIRLLGSSFFVPFETEHRLSEKEVQP